MRKFVLLAAAVLLLPVASAQLDVQVEPVSCPPGTNPLVTIPQTDTNNPLATIPQTDTTTGNPGGPKNDNIPSLYRNKVCVGNVEAPTMRDSCPGEPGFYLHSRGTDAHFSNKPVYPTEVCTGRLQITLRPLDTDGDGVVDQSNPCEPGEKQLFSVSNQTNAHIASPYSDFYRFKACGLLDGFTPNSVEIQLSLPTNNEVRSDDEPLDPDEDKTSFEYPYIASSDGSRVSALVSRSADTTALRQTSGQNTLVLSESPAADSLLDTSSSTSVLVPFTRGGFSSVEQREEVVTNGRLLETWDPAFGFRLSRDSSARSNYYTTYLDPDFDLTSNLSIEPGSYQLELEKTGENQIRVRRQ